MDLDPTLILLGLPLAFVLGWLASRFDLKQLRLENRQAPKAYFKGLNYLLNEQQDQAIDAFIEAVQMDPDTSELHFALGNLFRRRGEYERAVRVHQHLLSRGDLSQDDLHRAQHALALDYLKAGLLDRAEAALLQLTGTRFEEQAHLALLANYERARDWGRAADIAQKLEQRDLGSFDNRYAHYLCEQALTLIEKTALTEAQALLEQAVAKAPHLARPHLMLADMISQRGDHRSALKALTHAWELAPQSAPLLANPLAQAAIASHDTHDSLQRLQSRYTRKPSLDVLDAIILIESAQANGHQAADPSIDNGRTRYAQHLDQTPSLIAASKWIAGEKLEHEQFHPKVQRALDHAVAPLSRYRCMACGFEATNYFWQCPGCQAWDSYPPYRVEEL